MKKITYSLLVAFMVILAAFIGCDGDENGTGPDNPEIAKETWDVDIDIGTGDLSWYLTKYEDLTVTAYGDFTIINNEGDEIKCQFSDAPAVITDSTLTFTAHDTASFVEIPSRTSPFELTVSGVTNAGQSSGVYTMKFSAQYWPPEVTGTWTGSRISGSGITN